MKEQLEQSTWQARAAESKYLLLYDEAQTLKQQLTTRVCCNGEMEQRLINANKNALGYMNALYSKTVKSQITVRELFLGRFASFAQRL